MKKKVPSGIWKKKNNFYANGFSPVKEPGPTEKSSKSRIES